VNLIKINLQKINTFLLYFIVFLIPNQLAFHFWPNYSFVYGLRIDYLSIAIYLSDLLTFVYLIFSWLINKPKIRFSKSKLTNIFLLLFFVAINIFYSKQKELSLFKWIKIIELLLFSIAVAKNKFLEKEKIYKTFCCSVFFFGIIGVLQTIKGSTLGGLLYLLGERKFNVLTPGISLLNVFNISVLKPYSTFSHPNSLAGYLLLLLIYLFFWKSILNKDKLLKYLSILFIILLLLLSFSKAAVLTLFVIIIVYYFDLLKTPKRTRLATLVLIMFSLLLPLISAKLIKIQISYPDSLSERLFLSDISGQLLKNNPVFGIGLNNFIYNMPTLNNMKLPFWLLQPVHNIFLLVTVETGLLGVGVLLIILFKYIDYLFSKDRKSFRYIFLAILLTALCDHYWFTLEQNLILIFFFLGLSKNSQIK